MALPDLGESYDLVVIGGGITGAGVFREAVRMGLRVLLCERRDFAWGTSSRSSKLVHGGLRYLKQGQLRVMLTSVREREHLLRCAPGLVEPIDFLMPVYRGEHPSRAEMTIGLCLYDLAARRCNHRFIPAHRMGADFPPIRRRGLEGVFRYRDAQSDDTRMVIRLIAEGIAAGGTARNYTGVERILRHATGRVAGVALKDTDTGESGELMCPAVINATGAWAETFQRSPDPRLHLRPLRGSHLVLPREALPGNCGVGFSHPRDRRSVFVVPWEAVVLVGTTDLDHDRDLSTEPRIQRDEIAYLIEAARHMFPGCDIDSTSIVSTYCGIRPVLSRGGRRPPSAESREHAVWRGKGLVTVTGGKLTTFRPLAWDALSAVRAYLPGCRRVNRHHPVYDRLQPRPGSRRLGDTVNLHRLYGRIGRAAETLVAEADATALACIPGTRTCWAELVHGARSEWVRHLDDLLLRRTRIGLQCPNGGAAHLDEIRHRCRRILGWDDARWAAEEIAYRSLWHRAHSPFPHENEVP